MPRTRVPARFEDGQFKGHRVLYPQDGGWYEHQLLIDEIGFLSCRECDELEDEELGGALEGSTDMESEYQVEVVRISRRRNKPPYTARETQKAVAIWITWTCAGGPLGAGAAKGRPSGDVVGMVAGDDIGESPVHLRPHAEHQAWREADYAVATAVQPPGTATDSLSFPAALSMYWAVSGPVQEWCGPVWHASAHKTPPPLYP